MVLHMKKKGDQINNDSHAPLISSVLPKNFGLQSLADLIGRISGRVHEVEITSHLEIIYLIQRPASIPILHPVCSLGQVHAMNHFLRSGILRYGKLSVHLDLRNIYIPSTSLCALSRDELLFIFTKTEQDLF